MQILLGFELRNPMWWTAGFISKTFSTHQSAFNIVSFTICYLLVEGIPKHSICLEQSIHHIFDIQCVCVSKRVRNPNYTPSHLHVTQSTHTHAKRTRCECAWATNNISKVVSKWTNEQCEKEGRMTGQRERKIGRTSERAIKRRFNHKGKSKPKRTLSTAAFMYLHNFFIF